MAQANRVYGKNLSVFTIGGQVLVTLIQDATIDFPAQIVDATCCVDPVPVNLAVRQDYSITFRVAYDGAAPLAASVGALIDAVGTSVGFTVTSASGLESYTGTGLLSRGSHTIPDGGQSLEFEIIPDGTALGK